MVNWLVGGVLVIWALEDGRKKSISYRLLAVGGVGLWVVAVVFSGISLGLDQMGKQTLAWGISLVPGMFLLLCTKVLKGAVGAADGMAFIGIGPALGVWRTLAILWLSLLLFSVAAAILLVAGRATRKTRLPFLPFVLLGYLFCLLW